MKIEDTIISNNDAVGGMGGGVQNEGDDIELIKVIFSDNTANSLGGGLLNEGGRPVITNVIFSKNSAGYFGGGVNNYGGHPTFINVTFSGNSAGDYGGGLYNYEGGSSITNTVFWGNTASSGNQIYNNLGGATISYSLIQGSGGSSSWDSSLGTDGGGNIDADPLYIDATNDDLHLKKGSPAIDTGNSGVCPDSDLDGTPRPQGLNCDMGAYEYKYPLKLTMYTNESNPDPGEMITFTIRVTNNLTETITGGIISATLPTEFNFLDSITLEPPLSGTVGSAPPILVTSLTIGAGKQVTVTLPVSVSYGLPGGTIITNTAWVTSSQVITPMLGNAIITIANAPSVGVDDSGDGYSTNEDDAFTTANVLLNDTDPNGDTLAVSELLTTTTLGLVTNNSNGTFEYDPNRQFDHLSPGEQATDTFTYTVSDGELTDIAIVTITTTGVNDPPVVDVGPDQTVGEGSLIQFEGSYSDPDSISPDIQWDFGDGYTDTGTLTSMHTYPDDGVFTVTLNVTDTYGSTASDWLLVTVDNIAPVLSDLPDLEVTPGEIFTITGTITDPGVLDTQIVEITWAEGITETLELGAAERQFSFTHFYTTPGEYPITITVTDKDGGCSQKDFLITVTFFETYLPMVLK